jgi:hypothetical protein
MRQAWCLEYMDIYTYPWIPVCIHTCIPWMHATRPHYVGTVGTLNIFKSHITHIMHIMHDLHNSILLPTHLQQVDRASGTYFCYLAEIWLIMSIMAKKQHKRREQCREQDMTEAISANM